MLTIKRPVALISVHGDPAIEIGKEEAGGQNVYVRQVGEALGRLGWQVDMFTRRSSSDQPTIVEHSRNCRTIRLDAGPAEFIPRDQLFEYLPTVVEQIQQFQKQTGRRYELVHTNYWLSSWVGMQLKKLQSLKQVHTYHSLGYVKYRSVTDIPIVAATRLSVEKTCLETSDRIIATSPQEKHHLRSLVSKRGKIDIIPCGTDIQQFGSIGREAARQQLGIDPETQVILYVGRFDPRKGIETLVRAVALLVDNAPDSGSPDSNLKLIIAGGSRPGESDGRERERIEDIVGELGLTSITHFPGRLGHDQLPTYYAAADICVVPSHYEPFGLVTIESMASGTPVVASDVGGLQFTVLPEETGLLVPPKDQHAFADAIDRILRNPAWREQLGQAARQRVEDYFSWSGVASQLSQLYLQLLQPEVALLNQKISV
jgi:glycosyltransferase involved in cell wall biosynthesis